MGFIWDFILLILVGFQILYDCFYYGCFFQTNDCNVGCLGLELGLPPPEVMAEAAEPLAVNAAHEKLGQGGEVEQEEESTSHHPRDTVAEE